MPIRINNFEQHDQPNGDLLLKKDQLNTTYTIESRGKKRQSALKQNVRFDEEMVRFHTSNIQQNSNNNKTQNKLKTPSSSSIQIPNFKAREKLLPVSGNFNQSLGGNKIGYSKSYSNSLLKINTLNPYISYKPEARNNFLNIPCYFIATPTYFNSPLDFQSHQCPIFSFQSNQINTPNFYINPSNLTRIYLEYMQ